MSNFKIEVEPTLIFDSWVNPVPALRDAGTVDNRHLIYSGEGVILDVLIRRSSGEQTLSLGGQILHGFDDMESFDDLSNLDVSMEQDGAVLALRTNALGEFIFNGIPEGIWKLTIGFGERAFVVRRLSTRDTLVR